LPVIIIWTFASCLWQTSIYPCFVARPVAVNLANAKGEKLKLENEKVKIRQKGGC
jgi:hypothetical protein